MALVFRLTFKFAATYSGVLDLFLLSSAALPYANLNLNSCRSRQYIKSNALAVHLNFHGLLRRDSCLETGPTYVDEMFEFLANCWLLFFIFKISILGLVLGPMMFLIYTTFSNKISQIIFAAVLETTFAT